MKQVAKFWIFFFEFLENFWTQVPGSHLFSHKTNLYCTKTEKKSKSCELCFSNQTYHIIIHVQKTVRPRCIFKAGYILEI